MTHLIEFPADDAERGRRFWEQLLGVALVPRQAGEGSGWQAEHDGVEVGLHERGAGPGDRFSLPYFTRASGGRSAATRRGRRSASPRRRSSYLPRK